jgi:nucleoside-diphosphate-sugar epimerase
MSLLTTDLVYGNQSTYLFHYMAQSVQNGKIMANFHSEAAKFRPLHHSDLTRAVAHSFESPNPGHFGLSGPKEHSIRALLSMVENNLGKQASATNPHLNSVLSLLDDLFVGTTHDGNLDAMLAHYGEAGCDSLHQLQSFWEASGLSSESDVAAFFADQNAY